MSELKRRASGARLARLRCAVGMSQGELARVSTLSQGYISRLERGKHLLTAQSADVLASCLQVSVDYLEHGEDERIAAVVRAANLNMDRGRPRQALAGLLTLEPLGDELPPEAYLALSKAYELCGDLGSAIDVLDSLLESLCECGELTTAAFAAMALVGYYLDRGDFSTAIRTGRRVLAQVEAANLTGTDDHLRLGSVLLAAHLKCDDLRAVTECADRLLAQADVSSAVRGRASVYWNAALLAVRLGEHGTARKRIELADALMKTAPESLRNRMLLQVDYAHVLLGADPPEPQEALERLRQARAGLEASGSKIDVALLDIEQSRAHRQMGETDRAVQQAIAAVDRLEGEPHLDRCAALIALGDALGAAGRLGEVARAYRAAADQAYALGAGAHAGRAWRRLASHYRALGLLDEALDVCDDALEVLTSIR